MELYDCDENYDDYDYDLVLDTEDIKNQYRGIVRNTADDIEE
jgi:hypothetical protein